MNLQEIEIELKYLNRIIDRVNKRSIDLYENSPVYAYESYGFNTRVYDREYEAQLEQRAIKWRKTDEAKVYTDLITQLGKMLSIKSMLEGKQENYIIDKYKL